MAAGEKDISIKASIEYACFYANLSGNTRRFGYQALCRDRFACYMPFGFFEKQSLNSYNSIFLFFLK